MAQYGLGTGASRQQFRAQPSVIVITIPVLYNSGVGSGAKFIVVDTGKA